MDEPVRAVKNQVAAVDILRGPQNGKGIFLGALPRPFGRDIHCSNRPSCTGKSVAHRGLGGIRVKIHRFFFLGKGKVIKGCLRIYKGHNPPVCVLCIGEGSYAVNIVDDLHLLFIVQHGPFRIMEGQIKFHRISPVDLTGNDNIKGIFQNRLPCAVLVQHHRTGKAQLFIGGLWYIMELDFQQFRCSAGILGGKRHPETDILTVR